MIKLAVPDNTVYDKLLENFDHSGFKNEIELFRVKENECMRLILNEKVNAALLTPLSYGKGMYNADFRIIPGPALASEGFTSLASIFFKRDLRSIKKFSTNTPDDFIIIIGRLLLGERYHQFPELDQTNLSNEEIFKTSDTSIMWGGSKPDETALDISDEWYDSNNIPLPLAFWVCRAEEFPENILVIVSDMSIKDTDKRIIEELPAGKTYQPREGRLIMSWNDELERALEYTLHLLYYHQLLSDIPAVKVLGKV